MAGANLVIGTTGNESITENVIAAAAAHVRLMSLSSERVEMNIGCLKRMACRIEPLYRHPIGFDSNPIIGTRYILRPNGKIVDAIFTGLPANFSKWGVMCEQNADLVMSWLALCAFEVAAGKFRKRPGVLKDAADEVFEKYELAAKYERAWD